MFVCMWLTFSSICLSYIWHTVYAIILHVNFSCTTHQHFHFRMCCFQWSWITLSTHKKKKKNWHKHNCAWSAVSGSSSLGCGVANRMLSSVFPAGLLTVTLFPSWQTGAAASPCYPGRETPEKRRWKYVRLQCTGDFLTVKAHCRDLHIISWLMLSAGITCTLLIQN